MRIITFSKFDAHTSPLFKELNILQFKDVISLLNSLFMYNYNNNKLPSAFHNDFTSVSSRHSYNTRLASKSSYCFPAIRTNYGKFNIRFRGAEIWNSIDENYKKLSINCFKKKLKGDLLLNY